MTALFYLEEEVFADKYSLAPPPFIEVPVQCICVLEVTIVPLSTILIFDFGIVATVCYFFLFWNCSDSVVFFLFAVFKILKDLS